MAKRGRLARTSDAGKHIAKIVQDCGGGTQSSLLRNLVDTFFENFTDRDKGLMDVALFSCAQ